MDVQAAFLHAYETYADAIFRHCYFRVYHREQAKDLMQQTFLRVWQALGQGTEVENLRAFLYKVANNLIIDEARKKREQVSLEVLEESGFEPSSNPRPALEKGIDHQAIRPYLDQLDEKHREVVIMRYIDDLAPKEIAEILGESANVVSVRLHRAVDKLRRLIPSYVLSL